MAPEKLFGTLRLPGIERKGLIFVLLSATNKEINPRLFSL